MYEDYPGKFTDDARFQSRTINILFKTLEEISFNSGLSFVSCDEVGQ